MTPDEVAVPQPDDAEPPVMTPWVAPSPRSGTVGVAAVAEEPPESEEPPPVAALNSSGRDREGRHLEAEKRE